MSSKIVGIYYKAVEFMFILYYLFIHSIILFVYSLYIRVNYVKVNHRLYIDTRILMSCRSDTLTPMAGLGANPYAK